MAAGGSEESRICFLVSGDPETAVALNIQNSVCVCVCVCVCVRVSEMAKCMGQERNLKLPFSPELFQAAVSP